MMSRLHGAECKWSARKYLCGSGCGLSRQYLNICLEGLRETTKDVSQDVRGEVLTVIAVKNTIFWFGDSPTFRWNISSPSLRSKSKPSKKAADVRSKLSFCWFPSRFREGTCHGLAPEKTAASSVSLPASAPRFGAPREYKRRELPRDQPSAS